LRNKIRLHMDAAIANSQPTGQRTAQMPEAYTEAELHQLSALITQAAKSKDVRMQYLAAEVHLRITEAQN